MKREAYSASTRFQVTSDTLVKSFNNNIALLHMKKRRIHVLNSTATAVWNLLSSGRSRAEIQQFMLQEFSVNEAELATEIDRTLTFLSKEGFIQLHE
jgi:hypothetical protein